MTEKTSRLSTKLAAIQDDISVAQRGVSFLSPAQLQAGQRWMLERLANVPAAQRLYQHQRDQRDHPSSHTLEHGIQWRERAVRQYIRRVERFLDLLCLAVHITGGQPARGPELLSVRWRNGVLQDRNLYVVDGQVVVVTRYHKTQSQWDRPKVIARFLPEPVGQLMTAYLLYVRPVRALLLSSLGKLATAAASDYLWADEHGPWDTSRLTRIMTAETAERLGTRLTMADYRQVAVGIGREVVGERFATGYNKQQQGTAYHAEGEGSSSDEDGEDPVELQNGRSTAIGLVAYAVQADIVQGLSVRSIEVFRTLSSAWHAFLGLPSTSSTSSTSSISSVYPRLERTETSRALAEENAGKRTQQELELEPEPEQRQKRAKLATPYSGEKDREERLTDAVRQVLCIPDGQPVTYKSPD